MFVCGIQGGLHTDLFLMSVYICSLFSLYNLLPSSYGKAFVYKKALELATAGKAAEYIIPSFKNIDSFVSEWGIGNLEQRDLYLAITSILKDHKGCDMRDSLRLVIKFLSIATYVAWFCTDTIQSFSLMIDSMSKEYFNFLNKYLATFKGSDDESATIGDAKEQAVAAIIEFVKSSNLFQVLVYSSPCVRNIGSMRKKNYEIILRRIKFFP